MRFEYTKLPNGLELIGEVNPDARSAAVGILVRTGARDESSELNGVSHFLEHMIFKGTPRRTAIDVNREFDEIGARYNAFTSEENTVFWGAVLPEYLPRLVDLLTDMMRPSLRPDDFEVEKKVILEEIGMYQDQPMWSAYERVMREHFGAHPLGNSVLGTTGSVGGLKPDQMRWYFDRRYVAANMLVAAAGNLDWARFCDLIAGACADWQTGEATREISAARGSGSFHVISQKRIHQEHLVLIGSAPSAESPDRFAADVLATAVGDGTGSRLFWEFVDPGLAETAELEYHEFNGAGAFMTYLSCDPEEAAENVQRLHALYGQVHAENIRADELEQVKNKAASRIVLRSERPMGRLMPLGFNWAYRREYRTVDDDLAALSRVNLDDIARVLSEHPLDRLTCVAIGPLPEELLVRH
ncbi:MAG: insulinase family protein [Planctomycetes bacterium]|nr:insulinase family protein [Planctomycetota bacterium]